MSRKSKNEPQNQANQPIHPPSSVSGQITISGPIPPPQILAGYDEILPGSAERIIAMAEADAEHQRAMDRAIFEATSSERRRGQNYAAFIAVIAFVTALVSLYLGSPATASVIGGATVVGLVTVFVTGRRTSS
jgi:uncharacterized membrane protein